MLLEIFIVILLVPLLYYAWKQQGEIDDLKMMVGYILTVMEKEGDEDVSSDH